MGWRYLYLDENNQEHSFLTPLTEEEMILHHFRYLYALRLT